MKSDKNRALARTDNDSKQLIEQMTDASAEEVLTLWAAARRHLDNPTAENEREFRLLLRAAARNAARDLSQTIPVRPRAGRLRRRLLTLGALITGALALLVVFSGLGVILSRTQGSETAVPTLMVLPSQPSTIEAPTQVAALPTEFPNFTPTPVTTVTVTPTTVETLGNDTELTTAVERARNFSDGARNRDWQPFSYTFPDGAEMVLVPRGCFQMGSSSTQIDTLVQLAAIAQQNPDDLRTQITSRAGWEQTPQRTVCFENPFWIDKTESVANGVIQNGLSLWEAASVCNARGADVRLPTEGEWQYAARGRDSLLFPWGEDFNPNNTVYLANSNGQPSLAGSTVNDRSWVGALDMSGNVAEWTRSRGGAQMVNGAWSEPGIIYPYIEDDSRNNDPFITDRQSYRVIMGGSYGDSASYMSGTTRRAVPPSNSGSNYLWIGFRCMRSIEAAQTVQAGATTEQTSSIKTVLRECTEADISSAQAGVQSNEAWVTHRCSQVFDGVEMVLVPGSTDNRIPEPFWVARNEVRVEDYVSFLNRNVDIRNQVCDSPRQYQLCWLYSADATTSDGVTGNVIISNGRFEIAPFVSGKSSVVAITFAGADAYCKSLSDSNFIIYGPQWQYVFGESSAEANWVNAEDMSNGIFEWTSSGLGAGNEIRDGQVPFSYTITGSKSDITFRCARLVG